MLKCEKCGGYKLDTVDSRNRQTAEYKWRRKECKECGHVFTTVEITKSQYEKYVSYITDVNELSLKVKRFSKELESYNKIKE